MFPNLYPILATLSAPQAAARNGLGILIFLLIVLIVVLLLWLATRQKPTIQQGHGPAEAKHEEHVEAQVKAAVVEQAVEAPPAAPAAPEAAPAVQAEVPEAPAEVQIEPEAFISIQPDSEAPVEVEPTEKVVHNAPPPASAASTLRMSQEDLNILQGEPQPPAPASAASTLRMSQEDLNFLQSEPQPPAPAEPPISIQSDAQAPAPAHGEVAPTVRMDRSDIFPPAPGATVRMDMLTPDDLEKIEGIGPKVGALLNRNGISTFAQLAKTDIHTLSLLLEANSMQYMDPSTWPEQAMLAAEGKWDEFEKLTADLKGGRRKS